MVKGLTGIDIAEALKKDRKQLSDGGKPRDSVKDTANGS
jgi:hypothetical protein